MSPLIAITGASGNVGQALAGHLLDRGVKVRAIARGIERLQPLAARGAQLECGDLNDPKFMARAFRGADAVFAMIPPNYGHPDPRAYQRQIAEALASAVQVARVSHAVTLSSIGADQSAGTGPIVGLRAFEERFNQIPNVHLVHLRAGYFFQNFLSNIGLIRGSGLNGGLVAPDVEIAMIDARDVAPVAADLLANRSFSGRSVRELRAGRLWSFRKATGVLGAAIGRADLSYIRFAEADTRQALLVSGFSPGMADDFIEMALGLSEGLIQPRQPLSPATAAPTTLEQFAATVFAPAFAG